MAHGTVRFNQPMVRCDMIGNSDEAMPLIINGGSGVISARLVHETLGEERYTCSFESKG